MARTRLYAAHGIVIGMVTGTIVSRSAISYIGAKAIARNFCLDWTKGQEAVRFIECRSLMQKEIQGHLR
jgi:hypothetical protein